MSSASSPNGLFTLPAVASAVDADLWGAELNTNFNTADSLTTTRTLDLNFAGFQQTNTKMKRTSETLFSVGSITGAAVIDYADGNYQYATLTGNVSSLTITNPPASGVVGFLTLELIQDGTGSRTLTLLNTVYQSTSGAAIVLTTTAAAVDKLRLETRDGGSTWFVSPNLNIKFVP